MCIDITLAQSPSFVFTYSHNVCVPYTNRFVKARADKHSSIKWEPGHTRYGILVSVISTYTTAKNVSQIQVSTCAVMVKHLLTEIHWPLVQSLYTCPLTTSVNHRHESAHQSHPTSDYEAMLVLDIIQCCGHTFITLAPALFL